jgi:hypothetical protein
MSENTATAPVVATPVVATPVVAVQREIQAVAETAVRLMPAYKIRKTNANTFRNLTLVEDEKTNWKKGLIYLIARYSKGINFEMWMYGSKKSAGLAQFNDQVRPLAVGAIKCESLGHALKLRLQLPDAATDAETEAVILGFMEAVEPTLQAIREKIVVVVSKKETKAAAPVAPVVPVAPVEPEAPATEPAAPAAAAPVLSKRQMKKAAKAAKKV